MGPVAQRPANKTQPMVQRCGQFRPLSHNSVRLDQWPSSFFKESFFSFSDGSSSTLNLSWELESSCGRRDTRPSPPKRRQPKRCFRSWICTRRCTRSWWPSPWWRAGRRRRRSLQGAITPPPWRRSSLPAAEPSRYCSKGGALVIGGKYRVTEFCFFPLRVQHPIIWARTSPGCLRLCLRTRRGPARNNWRSRTPGESPQGPSVCSLWSTETTWGLCCHPELPACR